MKRCLLIGLLCAAGAGCYREPTNPVQVRQNVDAAAKSEEPAKSEPAMPNDSIHAGLDARKPEIIEARDVDLDGHVLTAPDEWVRVSASSMFLIAEFTLTRAEGDARDGRLTVSTAGGTIDNNLERWKGQFGGTPASESQETLDVGGVQVVLVDYTGTFNDSMGPMLGGGEPRTGYRMIGAIIPLGEKLFFVKGYGPEKTVAAHADLIRAFVQSLKPASTAPGQEAGASS